jgi:hypothetical protein
MGKPGEDELVEFPIFTTIGTVSVKECNDREEIERIEREGGRERK